MTFSEYWADLKINHTEKYEKLLKANRERQKRKRHAIYKNKELHEKLKAENRRKYRERQDRKKKNNALKDNNKHINE